MRFVILFFVSDSEQQWVVGDLTEVCSNWPDRESGPNKKLRAGTVCDFAEAVTQPEQHNVKWID
jgi:hypothetical protein